MAKIPNHEPNNASLVIFALFIIAALGQCGHVERHHAVTDACGGPGSDPVTIGSSIVIACR